MVVANVTTVQSIPIAANIKTPANNPSQEGDRIIFAISNGCYGLNSPPKRIVKIMDTCIRVWRFS
ncbi:MAG: hypothetical protein QOK52_10865 [Nitrososphaeraceae archaeon]|nr:hypothetical protein [Nitrososphaeraceae archaeon]